MYINEINNDKLYEQMTLLLTNGGKEAMDKLDIEHPIRKLYNKMLSKDKERERLIAQAVWDEMDRGKTKETN